LPTGGYADLHRVHGWNLEFVKDSPLTKRYEEMAGRISEALGFMGACGINSETVPAIKQTEFYTSHEALLLNYEEAMTRVDSTSGEWYDTSGALPVDRRTDSPVRQRAGRIHARHQEPDRPEMLARHENG
jgi:3-deoxy-7-phosphoheptulonate synthase